MQRDRRPLRKPIQDLPFAVIALADLNGLRAGAWPSSIHEHGPVVAAAKRLPTGTLSDVVAPAKRQSAPRRGSRRPARPPARSSRKSTMTLTRCSSTPSAETFMKPEGSTRRTRPSSGRLPPHCSISTASPRFTRTASVDEQVRYDLEAARIADLEERLAHGHDRRALAQPLEDDAVDRRRPPRRCRRRRSRVCSRAPRELQLVFGPRDREFGRAHRLLARS